MTKTTTTRTARVSKTVAAKPAKRTASKNVEIVAKRGRHAKIEAEPAKRARKTAEAPVKTAKRRVSKNVEVTPFRDGSVRANIVEMLSTKKGATIEAICKATGWSEPTIRARIGGLKAHGYAVENVGERGAATYRIS